MRVLLVEDEERLTAAIKHILAKRGIETDVALDGDEGLILALRDVYDMIILDIMLPGTNGLEILKTIRQNRLVTPVLLLTARDSINDRVAGLDAGADDYLVKPFAMDELIARVKALGRRLPSLKRETIDFEDLSLDLQGVQLNVGEKAERLSAREFQLLEMFMRRPGQVFSREYILDRVWGFDADVSENSIEVYMHLLRRKITSSKVEIATVRGVGYTLRKKNA
ncbi:MAG: response regulator transcription factor [Clostridiales bacterium]|jgi:DNA-binding response OmpR family regulator|nr:response regulator transcription factor [Clostridiales bacterium]